MSSSLASLAAPAAGARPRAVRLPRGMCSAAGPSRFASPRVKASVTVRGVATRAVTDGNGKFVAPPYDEVEQVGAPLEEEYIEGAVQYVPASSMVIDEVDFNVDDIMDTLECDLVQQFDKGADYTIYDENVVFVDPVSKVVGKVGPHATSCPLASSSCHCYGA